MRHSFRLGSKDYKPVQEKLYTFAVMTLWPRRPVQQVRQEDIVPNMNMDIGMEDGGAATTEESSVRRLPARKASCNGDGVVRRDNVVPDINMDVGIDGGMTGTPAVCNLHARKASHDGYPSMTHTEAGGTTGIPAVRNLHAQEASRDGDAVVQRDNVVPNINMDIGRPWHPEAQHRSIEDSAADAEAMDIDDAVDNDPIGLQIEADASDKTAEALWLVVTRTPIGGKATVYISMSIKELECAICAEQSHDSLIRQV